MIKNRANFCCTNTPDKKSTLCWDFTFDLGKSPPYFVLVTSYQNTTLLSKATKKCAVLIGPVLICHKKDEMAVKMLCDAMLDKCPVLEHYLKVLGSDGERSIINQICNAFPAAMLLICIKHVKDNIKTKFPQNSNAKTLKDLKGKFWLQYR